MISSVTLDLMGIVMGNNLEDIDRIERVGNVSRSRLKCHLVVPVHPPH